jgi:hypothetical protein
MHKAVRLLLILILVGILGVILYTGWDRKGPNQFEAAFNPGGKVTLDLGVGGYHIQGTNENKIWVDVESYDRSEVRCQMEVSGTSAKVRLEGPSNNFHATIYVPQRTDLSVDQSIGDLVVSNIEGNKKLGLGIGQMQIEVPSDAPRPSFDGSIIIGDLQASAWNVNKGGFFRGYYSGASGPYSIRAHVDIGELEIVDIGQSHSQKSENADDDVTDEDSEN